MGIFKDILKDFLCPGWDDVEERPAQKVEPEIRIKVAENDGGESYEDFMANLKEKRKDLNAVHTFLINTEQKNEKIKMLQIALTLD